MNAELTDRDRDVLARVAEGHTYASIAKTYGLSTPTLVWVGQGIIRKLGARNITNAVFLACQAGILDGRPRRHGDHAGYEAHRKRGEDPKQCEPCRLGERAHRAAMKKRTRT